MQKFETFTGVVVPFNSSNIDTDSIIPKQFLKLIKRTGFGDYLFNNRRYLDQDNSIGDNKQKAINPDFILNKSPYNKAEILLSRENFGCGSSREHAVWALKDFGFKVVIASSFSDIFYSNSFKNGLLAIKLNKKEIDDLFNSLEFSTPFSITVNLEKQFLSPKNGKPYSFDIEADLKERMLKGLDDIEITLTLSDKITEYESKQQEISPWLFEDISEIKKNPV